MSTDDDNKMIDGVSKVYSTLKKRGVDTRSIDTFFYVGERLLCFEGILVLEKQHPDKFDGLEKEMSFLKTYFREDVADLL